MFANKKKFRNRAPKVQISSRKLKSFPRIFSKQATKNVNKKTFVSKQRKIFETGLQKYKRLRKIWRHFQELQKFQVFNVTSKNFENSKNLISFARTAENSSPSIHLTFINKFYARNFFFFRFYNNPLTIYTHHLYPLRQIEKKDFFHHFT